MFAFLNTLALFAETGHAAAESGFMRAYNQYFNIPGFEGWKFLNLAIFIGLLVYVLRKPLGDAFRAKRDLIRAELIKAEAEKQAALAKLTSVEGRLAQLENEKAEILAKAKEEAAAEKKRLADQAKLEAARLRSQAEAELARLTAQSNAELRRYSAERSVSLAEEKLRKQIDDKVDARLVSGGLSEIGGLN